MAWRPEGSRRRLDPNDRRYRILAEIENAIELRESWWESTASSLRWEARFPSNDDMAAPAELPTELALLSFFSSSDSEDDDPAALFPAPPKLSSREERIQRAIDHGKKAYGAEQVFTPFGVSLSFFCMGEGWN